MGNMMAQADWYVDKGLGTLIAQVKARHPGMVVGTIASNKHHKDNPTSDHEPEKDGSVDAADFMIGPHFTWDDMQDLWEILIDNKDDRVYYIIWNREICSSHKVGDTPAWKPRPYNGKDPHTGHGHASVNDLHESDASDWDIDMNLSPASIAKVVDGVADEIEKRMALSKLGDRTVGGTLNALANWGVADHPVKDEAK